MVWRLPPHPRPGARPLRLLGRPGLFGTSGGYGPTPAPTLDEIAQMSESQIRILSRQMGLDDERVARMREDVARALRQLTEADNPEPDVIRKALDQAEKAVARHLTSAAKQAVRVREREQFEDEQELEWLGIVDDGLICDKCLPLDGETKTSAEWDAFGRPGDPDRTCGWPCRCRLIEAGLGSVPSEEEIAANIEISGTLIGGD